MEENQVLDEGKGLSVLNMDSPEIKELIQDETSNTTQDAADAAPQEMSIDDKLKLLEEKEQKLLRMEWKQKYSLEDDAMGLVRSEEDAQALSKLLKKQNSFKPENTRKEVIPISKKEFTKMNYNQRAQLYKQNPELYNTLSK